ncbi:thioesterase II family protein [Azohydromonas aeria]|uniref:thioesterase II family protein n=1 Tax=Azohydromonas aeria TaxID=2590212 RepID=UPI0012F968B4|nr:alpha/beta fold hydrolase [Azohydromonas aeria]
MTRLLCIPFSGGSALSYRGLGAAFDSIEVLTFELPGRGRRFHEPLLNDCHAMAAELLRQMRPHLHGPCVLFGHSLGSLLAYLVARLARSQGLPAPRALVVSGGRAPTRVIDRGWHRLPRPELHRVLRDLGGCPPAILAEPELMDLYEPVIRADFAALAHYRHEVAAPFDFPVTVLVGADDEVSEDDARAWQQETTLPLQLHRFPGNHFFIEQHWAPIRQLISAHVHAAGRPALERDPESGPPHAASSLTAHQLLASAASGARTADAPPPPPPR